MHNHYICVKGFEGKVQAAMRPYTMGIAIVGDNSRKKFSVKVTFYFGHERREEVSQAMR